MLSRIFLSLLMLILFSLCYSIQNRVISNQVLQRLPKLSQMNIATMSGLSTSICTFLITTAPVYADEDDALKALIIAKPSLDILINTMSVFFLARIIMSWYPKTDVKKFPYNIICWPTEPLMVPARDFLPPAFGVDISPIFWLGLLSFVREILTGQQGILTLMESS